MKLIVGLGNPGIQYEYTRHNIGFQFLNHLQKTWRELTALSDWSVAKRFNAEVALGKLGRKKIILLKPLTFMNESGKAVKAVAGFYKLSANDCVVIYDDIDLHFGNIRLRLGGSAGGHKGMQSIIQELDTEDIPRLRLGIRTDHHKTPLEAKAFVLKKFAKEEARKLPEIFQKSSKAINVAITESFSKAMSLYNNTR